MSIDKPAPEPIPSDLDKMTLPVRGTFRGKVKFTDKNGKIMEGEFEGGLNSGMRFIEGRMAWPNGWTHEGKFDPDTWTLMEGTKRYVNRMAFEGTFDKDTGNLIDGTKTDKDGHVSTIKNGKMLLDGQSSVFSKYRSALLAALGLATAIGTGIYIDSHTSQDADQNPSADVAPENDGFVDLNAMDETSRSAFIGKGKYTNRLGTKVEGQFEDGELIDGKKTFFYGRIEEGYFDNVGGRLIEGKITWADGQVFNIKNGELIEDATAPLGN